MSARSAYARGLLKVLLLDDGQPLVLLALAQLLQSAPVVGESVERGRHQRLRLASISLVVLEQQRPQPRNTPQPTLQS